MSPLLETERKRLNYARQSQGESNMKTGQIPTDAELAVSTESLMPALITTTRDNIKPGPLPDETHNINCNQTRSARHSQPRQPRQGRRTKKLSTEEKAKVLEVRRQRACLRCKMLKIQCSKENPCKPCLSSAVRGYERKVLSFCYCVRTRFVDVDIFQSSGFGPTPEIPTSVSTLIDQIRPHNSQSLGDDVFEDTLIRWLTNPDFSPPDGSIVALLCDKVGNSESLRRAVDVGLTTDFRIFLLTTSLANTGWNGHVAHRDLCIAGHLCGSRIMRRLDRILTPQFLSKCNRETHRALLLLVFGLILGVGYSTRVTTSPSFPHALLGAELRHSPTLWLAMKEHLAQMLAHHLIFLGSILGIKLDTASEKTIIDTAVNRWNKVEHNVWAGFVGDSLPGKISPSKPVAVLDNFNSIEDAAQKQQQQQPTGLSVSQPRASLPATPLVALSCPDLVDLQTMPHLSENPASYLSMTGEDYEGMVSPIVNLGEPRPPSDLKDLEDDRARMAKRRSVWIVQPFDGNGTQEPVNVFARFRLQPGQNVGLFV